VCRVLLGRRPRIASNLPPFSAVEISQYAMPLLKYSSGRRPVGAKIRKMRYSGDEAMIRHWSGPLIAQSVSSTQENGFVLFSALKFISVPKLYLDRSMSSFNESSSDPEQLLELELCLRGWLFSSLSPLHHAGTNTLTVLNSYSNGFSLTMLRFSRLFFRTLTGSIAPRNSINPDTFIDSW